MCFSQHNHLSVYDNNYYNIIMYNVCVYYAVASSTHPCITIAFVCIMSTSIRTDINTDYSVPDPFQVTFSVFPFVDTISASGIMAMDDVSIEGPHSFNVFLQSVPAAFMDNVVLDTTPQTVTIVDDDGKLVHHTP